MTDKAEFERLLDVYGFRCERFGQDLSTHARAQVVSAFAALASAPVAGEPNALELRGVPETIKDGDGFWRSCTGCHELNEGRDTGRYSAVLGCHLGQGCRECGGIGAVWDSTDYQAMADDMARDMGQSVSAAPQASAGEAQPVAWRYQTPTGWHATTDAQKAVSLRAHHPVEPLYPKPQASAEPTHKPAMSVAEFCAEAGRLGLTADTLAAQLSQRPEFADCLPQADKAAAPCTCPSGDGSLRHPCQMHTGADKDGGQQRAGVVTDDMRYSVRFAPSSAHWSERLVEFFGPDAREGIDALERQLREARAALSAPQAGQGERDA